MIGNILLSLALAAGVFSVVMYYLTYKGYENTLKFARISFHATAVLVMAASALLLHAILTHQFEYKIYLQLQRKRSSNGLLMSTFYAGQEEVFCYGLYFLQ
jgi:cytochrome c-type biogenesis protein CcmF